MSTIIQPQINFKIKGIELIHFALNPIIEGFELKNVYYGVYLEHKADAKNQSVFVLVDTVVTHNQERELAKAGILFTYHIQNFNEVFLNEKGNIKIPSEFISSINSLSISTTRGILFSHFNGTYLHEALMPVIDPNSFHRQENELQ